MALYFRGIFFFALVSTGEEVWNLTAPGPVKNNTWNEIGIRWSKDTGLELFINAERIAHVMYPDKLNSIDKNTESMEFNIGCRKDENGEYVDFAYGEYDEMTVWMWALAEDQEHFYLGGYDANSTCDPELHPLRCETNIEKILENMGNVKIESADALTDALEHLKALSEVQKDPPGSDNEEDENADNRYKEEVRDLVTILEKLMNMTWDKPDNLKVKDLEKMMTSVQEIASNVLEEKYTEGWKDMTNEGKSSIEFVNQVGSYQVHQASKTNNGKEPIELNPSTPNILTNLYQAQLYSVLARDMPISFPPEDEDGTEEDSKRKKRDVENEDKSADSSEDKENTEPNVKFTITKEVFGEIDRSQKVAYLGASYKKLHKISPLWNRKTGNETTLIFIDSEIASVSSNPDPSSANLQREPVTITLKHTRKVKASGRKLLADKDLQENGEIRRRECMRWDKNLVPKGTKVNGGWTTDSCSVANTSAEETTCQCTMLGTYAVISKIRQPFFIPEEEEWVKFTKWVGYGFSITLLLFYILVIIFRTSLHEEFHIIRLNLSIAALGALISFMLRDFLYEDEDVCRIISILVHFFYVAVGTWLISEAHALFSALINGSFGGKFLFYVMIGWVFPAGMCGGCFSVIYNYGYDYRCLVGPTTGKRLLLVGPVIFAALIAFTFAMLTCINYGTPAVKKTAIVNELSSATRYNFIVIILFLSTWLFGVFAIVDLGFDSDEIPAFNPIFQIMNSFLGIFIVALTGFGSKYFRYSLCHTERNKTETKALYQDPFDIHDKANIAKRKKIYAS